MIGYSSYSDPRLQPPEEDDRWESIAEGYEKAYSTGQELRDRVDSVLFDLDLIPDFAAIYEGHPDDIPQAAERLVRRVLGLVQDRIEEDAREEAIAEVERADEQAKRDEGEARYEAMCDREVA